MHVKQRTTILFSLDGKNSAGREKGGSRPQAGLGPVHPGRLLSAVSCAAGGEHALRHGQGACRWVPSRPSQVRRHPSAGAEPGCWGRTEWASRPQGGQGRSQLSGRSTHVVGNRMFSEYVTIQMISSFLDKPDKWTFD